MYCKGSTSSSGLSSCCAKFSCRTREELISIASIENNLNTFGKKRERRSNYVDRGRDERLNAVSERRSGYFDLNFSSSNYSIIPRPRIFQL